MTKIGIKAYASCFGMKSGCESKIALRLLFVGSNCSASLFSSTRLTLGDWSISLAVVSRVLPITYPLVLVVDCNSPSGFSVTNTEKRRIVRSNQVIDAERIRIAKAG